jgi:integrase/recombinase XerD
MINKVFCDEQVRRRLAQSQLGIILGPFIRHLQQRGHTASGIHTYAHAVGHFAQWLRAADVPVRRVDEKVIERFLAHLARCRCPQPAPKDLKRCRSALGRLLEFLRQQGRCPAAQPCIALSERDRLLQKYGRYLDEVCGIAPGTRRARQRHAREFLQSMFGNRSICLDALSPLDISGYVQERARKVAPSTSHDTAASLRKFLRFSNLIGWSRRPLAAAVPSAPPWPRPPLPSILSEEQLRSFLHSFDRSTATGLRDFAIALCLCHLGLRTHEIAELSLRDVDWRRQTICLRQTKQARERLLPLPTPAAKAILAYLRKGRPASNSEGLFVRHGAPVGEALRAHHVRGAMLRAFARCGVGGSRVHILRHTFATRLHRRGAGLKAIADLLGHRSLNTTANYARVDLRELRQAALPWPEDRQ